MKRVQLVLLGLLLYIITIGYIISQPYFSYSTGNNILNGIPKVYWSLLCVDSIVLTLTITKTSQKKLSKLLAGLLYGLLFYITNLYFVIPYEQTDTNVAPLMEFIISSGRITHKALATHSLSYLSYPVSFILEAIMILIGGIGRISIYAVGLLVFMSAFYIGLIYYYYSIERDIEFAIFSLTTYIILSFYVIDDQVAPQTLALVFIPYLYKLTFDFIENGQSLKTLLLIMAFWLAIVFTHPFMFLFYILPIIGIILYDQLSSTKKHLRVSTIGLLLSVWGFGFIWLFYNLLSVPIRVFMETWGKARGETWWVFNFLRRPGAFGPVKYTPHPHYELIPKWIVGLQGGILRILLISLLIIVTYGFAKEIWKALKTKKLSHQLVFDVNVIASSGILFLLGLITTFLGQRVFQVAFIPFSKYIKGVILSKRSIRWIVLGILILSPLLFTVNILINQTVGAPMLIRETRTIEAGGQFLD